MKKILISATFVFLSSFSMLFSQTLIRSKPFEGIPNLNKTFEFEKYNENAPLKSVTIQISFSTEGGYFGTAHENNYPVKTIFNMGASTRLHSEDVRLIDSKFQPVISEIKNSSEYTVIPGSYEKVHKLKNLSASESGIISSKFLDDFSGSGVFKLNLDLQNLIESDQNEAVKFAFSPPVCRGKVTIIYSY